LNLQHIDLLVFGPHPDDIEIGFGGSVAAHAAGGFAVGLCDLTRGEMGTNGTPEERVAEAEEAARILGAAWRVNLGLPDRELRGDPTQVRAVTDLIRAARPRVIAAPYWEDRHPDHGAASRLVTDAAFNAGLRRYGASHAPWRPSRVCYYFINDSVPPSFVLDVSAHYDTKRRALASYRSQFAPSGTEAVETRLTSPLFLQLLESRDGHFGALAGVRFAEGVVVKAPVVVRDLFDGARPPRGGDGS
jgi:bacillithiol biosynthesis deacetylase BshB1